MRLPGETDLMAALSTTWPAARVEAQGPWVFRDGAGGGKRVSATSTAKPVGPAEVDMAEARMMSAYGSALFQLTAANDTLDQILAARGYDIIDPTRLYVAPVTTLSASPLPPLATFTGADILAVMAEIWAEGGIGPARLAIMDRAHGPKTLILGRTDDSPAGAAFVAMHESIAMIHAIEVRPPMRRKGVARHIITRAAQWAEREGAASLALAVTAQNAGANALYASLGMRAVGQYHYRIKQGAKHS